MRDDWNEEALGGSVVIVKDEGVFGSLNAVGLRWNWLDPYEHEPPRYTSILFVVDRDVLIGEVFGEEKIRKCFWQSGKYEFDCDGGTEIEKKVTHWMPLPEPPVA